MAITDWPVKERPRERLLALGAAALADAELLAILLRTGIKGKTAVDLARQLLGRFGSVAGLLDAGSTNLAETPGLGTAKLAQLQAALELARRALKHNAAAVIFAHNHPSGVAEPSHADEILTRSLKAALALVDIQVLDHFIVAGSRTMSFAERGLL